MKLHSIFRLARPAALLLLIAAVLVVGGRSVAWASPSEQGTIPTAAPSATPVPPPPPPEGGSSAPVGPGESDTVTTTDGSATVVITSDDLGVSGWLEVAPAVFGTLPRAGTGFTFLGKQITVTLFDAQGNAYVRPSFTNPIQVCFNYTDADLALVGGDPNNFVVQYFDTQITPNAWVNADTTVDTVNRRACGNVTHLTLFALAAQSSKVTKVIEVTGGESPMAWIWVAALAVLAAAALTLARTARRASRK